MVVLFQFLLDTSKLFGFGWIWFVHSAHEQAYYDLLHEDFLIYLFLVTSIDSIL